MSTKPLTFTLDPPVTPELHADIAALWADVSNAGGAVGFTPPVTADDVRPELAKLLATLADGRARLLVGRDEAGRTVATAELMVRACCVSSVVRPWGGARGVWCAQSQGGESSS